jgi:hypothetical protein
MKRRRQIQKIQPDPRMMQSIAEHQEVPKEEATLMLVGGRRKRCRDQNLATGHRQKPKGRSQASCESQKILTIAGRRMTPCAECHGSGKASSEKIVPGSMWYKKSGEDGRSGGDASKTGMQQGHKESRC